MAGEASAEVVAEAGASMVGEVCRQVGFMAVEVECRVGVGVLVEGSIRACRRLPPGHKANRLAPANRLDQACHLGIALKVAVLWAAGRELGDCPVAAILCICRIKGQGE